MNYLLARTLAQLLLEGKNTLHNGVVREHPAWEKEQLTKSERRGKTHEDIQALRWQKYAERQKEKGMNKKITCPACEGDGIERCTNPDHGFINEVGEEIGRLGCPVCGRDEQHRVMGSPCPECDGSGLVERQKENDR